MDNDDNKDRLDDFLNKAFEQFESNPSDQVWGRIQHSIQGNNAPRSVGVKYAYWAATAVVVVLLFLMQYYYFSTQIKDLKENLNAQSQNIAVLMEDVQKKNRDELPTPAQPQVLESDVKKDHPLLPTEKNNRRNTRVKSPAKGKNSPVTTDLSGVQAIINDRIAKKGAPIPANEPPNPTPINHTFEDQEVTNIISSVSNTLPTEDPTATTVHSEPIRTLRPTESTFQPVILLGKIPTVINRENLIPNFVVIRTVTPQVARTNRHLSIGLRTIGAVSTTTTSRRMPDHPGFPPSGGDKYFLDDKPTKGNVFVAGLSLQKPLSSRWTLVSGMDYTQTKVEQSYQPKLNFEDRRPSQGAGGSHGGGPHNDDHEHDFNYYVGTGTGTCLVNIELREKDSSQTIPNTTPINFNLDTKHKVMMAGIPVGLQYKWSKRNWNAFVGAGLRMNLLLKTTQQIERFESNNNLFEVSVAPSLTAARSKEVELLTEGYLTAGLEYRFNHFGIQVAPVLNRPLTNDFDDHQVSLKRYWAGVNVGVQYYW